MSIVSVASSCDNDVGDVKPSALGDAKLDDLAMQSSKVVLSDVLDDLAKPTENASLLVFPEYQHVGKKGLGKKIVLKRPAAHIDHAKKRGKINESIVESTIDL